MSKKSSKDKKHRPLPKSNPQIPISAIRKFEFNPLPKPGEVVRHAREFPIHGCWIMSGWQESGITPVVVARQQEPGRILFASYMVDMYCLGIKDAFTRSDFTMAKFERELPKLCANEPEPCSVELAHEVIYGALEYAAALGFEPAPEFRQELADLVLDPPDAHPRSGQVVFGHKGKPLYVAGPYDNEARTSQVIATLKRTCGEGNYDYLLGLPGGPF